MSNDNRSDASVKNLNQVIKIDQEQVQSHLGEMVRSTVQQTLNQMLDAEADQLCQAKRYERSPGGTLLLRRLQDITPSCGGGR